MASVQDIKRRVSSVRNTRKITKAMELVAAAKLRRAEARIEALRPYADRMRELMAGTARATAARGFPLLEERQSIGSVAILALTGDRGLAGGFNAQIVRRAIALAREAEAEGQEVKWLAVGKKGRSTLRFRRFDVTQAWVDLTGQVIKQELMLPPSKLTFVRSGTPATLKPADEKPVALIQPTPPEQTTIPTP